MKAIIFSLLLFILFNCPENVFGQKKYQTVKYCNLFASSKPFENVAFKTTAYMTYSTVSRVDGGDSFFYFPDCNNGDYFAVSDFSDLNDYDSKKLDKCFLQLPEEKQFIFEIGFIGKLQTSVIPTFGHLSWSRSEIEILQINFIRIISPTEKLRPNFDAETVLTNKGKALQTINTGIVFSLLGHGKNTDLSVENFLAEDLKIKGDKILLSDKQDYRFLPDQEFFNAFRNSKTLAVGFGSIEENKNVYTIKGKITADKNKILKYENRYIFENENWLLKETDFFTN